MAQRILSTKERNRALLARQLLLERSKLPLTKVVEQMGGIQNQNAPAGYIALWARMESFSRSDLTEALEGRSVVQGTLLRATIHLVSSRDYPSWALAIREARRTSWLKSGRAKLDSKDVADLAALTQKLLADGPLKRPELMALLNEKADKPVDSSVWNGIGLWLDLVRVPPSGTWDQRRADLYDLADNWLGAGKAKKAARQSESATAIKQATSSLVKRYLGAFGPASPKNIANWAGISLPVVQDALNDIEVVEYRDESDGALFDVRGGLIPDSDTPAPVRFLPAWDAMLLAHARDTQVLPDKFRDLVYKTRTPQSESTFLIDGSVAGTWKHERGKIHVQPFEPLKGAAKRELAEETERFETFLE